MLLLIPGLVYSLRPRRWRRVLAEYPWRAVRYRYTQRVSINTTGEGTTTTVLDQLTILDPATAEPSPGQLCRSDFMDRRWERL